MTFDKLLRYALLREIVHENAMSALTGAATMTGRESAEAMREMDDIIFATEVSHAERLDSLSYTPLRLWLCG